MPAYQVFTNDRSTSVGSEPWIPVIGMFSILPTAISRQSHLPEQPLMFMTPLPRSSNTGPGEDAETQGAQTPVALKFLCDQQHIQGLPETEASQSSSRTTPCAAQLLLKHQVLVLCHELTSSQHYQAQQSTQDHEAPSPGGKHSEWSSLACSPTFRSLHLTAYHGLEIANGKFQKEIVHKL